MCNCNDQTHPGSSPLFLCLLDMCAALLAADCAFLHALAFCLNLQDFIYCCGHAGL